VDAVAPRALVLDLDGTVWDSYPWLARVVGGGRGNAEREALAGLRDSVPVARLLDRAGVTRSRFRRICAEAQDFEPYPGVRETLAALHRSGVPLGVVTNLPDWVAAPMLDCLDLRSYFDSFVPFSRNRPAKPHPAPIEASLAELDVQAGPRVWYVGDAESDAEAADRAGVSFAWASYGYGALLPKDCAVALSAFPEVLDL